MDFIFNQNYFINMQVIISNIYYKAIILFSNLIFWYLISIFPNCRLLTFCCLEPPLLYNCAHACFVCARNSLIMYTTSFKICEIVLFSLGSFNFFAQLAGGGGKL